MNNIGLDFGCRFNVYYGPLPYDIKGESSGEEEFISSKYWNRK